LGIVKSVGYDHSKPLNPEARKEENGKAGEEAATVEVAAALAST